MVKNGPSAPTSDAALAPMRRIDSAISSVGSTVEKIAIEQRQRVDSGGTASASTGRVSANWASTKNVEASIAHATKRNEPTRAMMPPACTR